MRQRPCARPHPMLPWLMPMVLAFAGSSAMAYDCTGVAEWNAATAYGGNAIVKQTSTAYQAKWWTQNNPPATNAGQWDVWKVLGACDGGGGGGGTNKPPTVALSAPGAGASPTAGDTVTLAATAADSDGTVAKVGFYVNGALVAEDTTAPFSIAWTARAGVADITARATDDKGATTESAAVRITVQGQVTGDERCRPEGLTTTAGTAPAYCKVYDDQGREKMGADKPRRIIGYFTSWRTGKTGQPAFLAHQIPWGQVTHINYAFAHVDAANKLSVGNTADAANPATGLTWPGIAGAEMDPAYAYKGHFNLLNKFKKQYPTVKTLISVGGWAETGGFYTMTTNADGSTNTAGINAFADSAVTFLRQYGFDGVDIDYEYPTSMNNAGNPVDFAISNARRGALMKNYVVLMRTLRAKLDAASQADQRHYLLTIAAPSSAYLLRGMEAFQVTQYLDYVNIMSYDLHGAWNQFVGPNAALYDDGKDAELTAWSYYSATQYARIGYLNTDWAYHYFRGAMPAGRINIGVPYYTRGWQGVTGGTNGLWGQAALPDQSKCPAGTGGGTVQKCGNGAVGIDNLWHDLDVSDKEVPAGSNPMWHAMNLASGRPGSYLAAYGLNPATNPADQLTGTYVRNYDATLVSPWLWNAQKKVFISTEDDQSLGVKAQYVADRGIGGVMFWEFAGDYAFDTARNEYFIGNTLTTTLYNKLKTAPAYGNRLTSAALPAQTLDIGYALGGFALGDSNYPITPKLTLTNNSTTTLPGGTEFQFDVPTAIPATVTDQSGFGLTVISNGSNPAGNNVGGLKNDFHRASFKLPSWQSLAPGASVTLTINYFLPSTMPSNWTVTVNGRSYALAQEARRGAVPAAAPAAAKTTAKTSAAR
nr:glycosyl hydrolase family 18 protein [uncultured Roseateles sp.]